MNETYVTVMGNVATKVGPLDIPFGSARCQVPTGQYGPAVRQAQGVLDGCVHQFLHGLVVAWAGHQCRLLGGPRRTVGVRGQLRIVEDEREGRRYLSAELMASTVGHDLTRGTAAFVRVSRANPELTRVPEPARGPELTRGPAPTWPPLSADAAGPPFGASDEGVDAAGVGSGREGDPRGSS